MRTTRFGRWHEDAYDDGSQDDKELEEKAIMHKRIREEKEENILEACLLFVCLTRMGEELSNINLLCFMKGAGRG